MKVNVDSEFAKNMPWYAKVTFAMAMYLLDLTMQLSGMEETK
jgi:hypothetical protein